MKFNVFTEQKKSEIIAKYLESIAPYKVTATSLGSGNNIELRIAGNLFNIDTSKNIQINSRNVLSR